MSLHVVLNLLLIAKVLMRDKHKETDVQQLLTEKAKDEKAKDAEGLS